MPIIKLETNVKPNKVPDEKSAILKLSKLAAETLGVPESLFAVTIQQELPLSFGGTFDPAFVLTVTAIGVGSPGVNKKCTQAFTKHLQETLGVSDDRGYIILFNPGSNFVGYKGDTADIVFA